MKNSVVVPTFIISMLSCPVFAAPNVPCTGTYVQTYGNISMTAILNRSTDKAGAVNLTGSLQLAPNIIFGLVGVVDSGNNCFVSAWGNNLPVYGSMILAGKLTETTNNGVVTGTFDFGGGAGTGGLINQIVLSDMQKTATDGTPVIPTAGAASNFSYGGTYFNNILSIPLAQSNTSYGSVLTGSFLLSSPRFSGYVGGFVDSSNKAFVMAYWRDIPTIGSGIMAGSLELGTDSSGTPTGTFNFGGGQSTSGRISPAILYML